MDVLRYTENSEASRIRPKHILNLNTDEKLEFLASFDRVFSDIDGVAWNLTSSIPRAVEGYQALIEAGKTLNFISNNSVRSPSEYERKFKDIGLEVDLDALVHPAKSILQYLKHINFKGLIYVIATERVKDMLREAGYDIIDGPTKIIKESFSDLARHVFGDEPVRAVIIDVDFNLSSPKLIRAHVFLRHPDCILIEGATDKLLPVGDDLDIIGPGPFAQVLAESSKKHLITLGKPGKELAEMLVKNFEIEETKRVLMIGDMLEQDIGFGRQCGFQTLVVLSGGCKLQDLESETIRDNIPDYYADSIADFIEFMNDLNKSNV
ncbi:PREDICTED: pyridoxal phosphate phosphatase isoform X1 [Rhagoletis zephyria]|uniref:pyridoxal phosphate phosphatase isoform X1 n=1 Tax=Rhagoletis zephyria TaxID=28612 RepID=UPI0008119A8C|nr:PREDICTED: pyridoxal phosphate phosphatase isoform X1 [Rhagoletis zephyria]